MSCMNIYWNLPWREECWLENSSRRVFYWVIRVWVVRLIDEHIIRIVASSWQHGRPVVTYWRGKVHDVVGITGDARIFIVVWTLRMRVLVGFECRVLVRSGLVVVIQRVRWVMAWHGEWPGRSVTQQLTSTSSTTSTSTCYTWTSTLTATSVHS